MRCTNVICLLVCFVFLLHSGLLAWRGERESPVIGEINHLSGGVSHILLGRFDVFRVNPPLVRTCAAFPVVIAWPSTDWKQYDTNLLLRMEGVIGTDFVRANGGYSLELLCFARWACILFSLLGAWICWHWSQTLGGAGTGLLAIILWCFSPYILGHGSTIMPDVPSAVMGVAAVYCFWRWLKRPGWFEVIVAGVVLGLAELCKFTLLIFYPMLPVLWIVYRLPEWRAGNMAGRDWLRQSGVLAVLLLLSVYIINCGYLFEGTFTPLEKFRFQTMMFTGCESFEDVPPEGANRFAGTWLGKLPVPLPANMVQGIDTQRYDFERGLPSYLRGEWQKHGWWYYYLYALAVKVPLGTWCLVGLAVGVTIFGRGFNAPWRDEMVVLVPGLVILVFVSSQTGFSVHSRYVIPALPFFFVWISKVARVFEMRPLTLKRWAFAAMVVIALTWSVGSSLWAYPHSLSYFNELTGGPKGGGEHLLDSNIDWGQDLLYLKDWLDKHPDAMLDGLAFYGSYPATLAGIPETPYPPPGPAFGNSTVDGDCATEHLGPKPGWYAVSVNYLYGRNRQYRYFLNHFQPIASAGYSIYIYHITPDDANRARRESGLTELSDEEGATLYEQSREN